MLFINMYFAFTKTINERENKRETKSFMKYHVLNATSQRRSRTMRMQRQLKNTVDIKCVTSLLLYVPIHSVNKCFCLLNSNTKNLYQ